MPREEKKRHLQCRLMSELSPPALVSSDTSYEPRISFFMRGMNLVLSNPGGEARLGRTQQPGSYAKPRWLMDDCYGSRGVSANTFSRMATATTYPITSTSFKGRTSICDGESGCGCKRYFRLPLRTSNTQIQFAFLKSRWAFPIRDARDHAQCVCVSHLSARLHLA